MRIGLDIFFGPHRFGMRKPTRRHRGKIYTVTGVGFLHTGFAVTLVVDDTDCQVTGQTPMVARLPMPISISPSPVSTITRRPGCALASPGRLPPRPPSRPR